jgi:hypothetical protein
MTMAAFRLARARQINDDWKFPKFLALVMPKDALGQAVAIDARASASEVLLDAEGSAHVALAATLPVGDDSFFKQCVSITEQVRCGNLLEDSFTVHQASGSQIFNVRSDIDGCCKLLFSSANLVVTGGVTPSREIARLTILARVARVLSRALRDRERDGSSSECNSLHVDRLLVVADVLTCNPCSTPPVRLSKCWDGTDYKVADVDHTELPGVCLKMVVERERVGVNGLK